MFVHKIGAVICGTCAVGCFGLGSPGLGVLCALQFGVVLGLWAIFGTGTG